METLDFSAELAALRALPETVFWLDALEREPYGRRLGQAERLSLAAAADRCGCNCAAALLPCLVGKTVETLCEEQGIEICEYRTPDGNSRVVFALFEPPGRVSLRPDIPRGWPGAAEGQSSPLGSFDCREVLLAHELYHYLEYRNRDALFTRKHRETVGRLGPIPFRRRLISLSEIAAMAFARVLTGLTWSPFLLDCILLGRDDPASAGAILEQWKRLDKKLRKEDGGK